MKALHQCQEPGAGAARGLGLKQTWFLRGQSQPTWKVRPSCNHRRRKRPYKAPLSLSLSLRQCIVRERKQFRWREIGAPPPSSHFPGCMLQSAAAGPPFYSGRQFSPAVTNPSERIRASERARPPVVSGHAAAAAAAMTFADQNLRETLGNFGLLLLRERNREKTAARLGNVRVAPPPPLGIHCIRRPPSRPSVRRSVAPGQTRTSPNEAPFGRHSNTFIYVSSPNRRR